jgi:hypothetical protein
MPEVEMSRVSLMPFMYKPLTLHPTDSLNTAGVQPLIITHFFSKEQEFLDWAHPPPSPPRPELTDRRAIPIYVYGLSHPTTIEEGRAASKSLH